jgi:SAM-dependent methyltransferase
VKKGGHEPAVERYRAAARVRWPTNTDTFRRQMKERHGAATLDRTFAALGKDGASTPAFYELKNRSLRFSLDVSFQMDGNFYACFLDGVTREHEKHQPVPRRILDLGCDCGLLTCFYAQHFPEAEVVGLDSSVGGIENARELASELELKNVRFQVGDIRELEKANLSDAGFDLITFTCVLRDALGFPHVPANGPLSWAALPPTDMWARVLSTVRPLLTPGGIAFSTERVMNPRAMAWWVRSLSDSGIEVLWDRSALLEHDSVQSSPNGTLRRTWLPVLTCRQGAIGLPTLTPKAEGLLGKWA